jgi:hypothetical protein
MTQIPETMTTDNPTPEKMTLAEFEQRLPEFFATGTGSISSDPRLQAFLAENPDSAALVRDLEYIAAAAGDLLKKEEVEPSDSVWQNIQNELKSALPDGPEPEPAS